MRRLSLVLLVLFVSGCEDEVSPTLGLDIPFSLYGYLDPTSDVQAVRVVPIVGDLEATERPVEAIVTSTDLEDGTVVMWRDSVVTFSDGTAGLIHVADFTPRPGATYQIEAAALDGTTSRVTVAVPPIVPASVGPPTLVPGEATYPVRFEGAPRVLNGQLRLTVSNFPGALEGETRLLTVPTSTRPREVEPDIWTIEVAFVSATRRVLEREGLVGTDVRLIAADYVGFVANERWNVPVDDVNALAEPGVFSNVEGGLGFVGAGYFASARWVPDPAILIASGFKVEGDVAARVTVNEVSVEDDWVELYNPLFTDVNLSGYSLSGNEAVPRQQVLPFGTVVPAGGFLVVDLAFDHRIVNVSTNPDFDIFQATLVLYNRASEPLSRVVSKRIQGELDGISFGSFPDGQSFPLRSGEDLFQGPLLETRGGPNVLGLEPASINEVYTEGSSGWVEAVAMPGDASDLRVMTTPGAFNQAVPFSGAPFAVADEQAGALDLSQLGGELYLVSLYIEPRLSAQGRGVALTRVVDVRRYGGQTPGRSVGYFPDAASGAWTTDLRPTRGAPNAQARRSSIPGVRSVPRLTQ